MEGNSSIVNMKSLLEVYRLLSLLLRRMRLPLLPSGAALKITQAEGHRGRNPLAGGRCFV